MLQMFLQYVYVQAFFLFSLQSHFFLLLHCVHFILHFLIWVLILSLHHHEQCDKNFFSLCMLLVSRIFMHTINKQYVCWSVNSDHNCKVQNHTLAHYLSSTTFDSQYSFCVSILFCLVRIC